jgi:1-phosphofructokinase
MIVTITLNPAIDKTASLEELQIGELNRMQDIVVDIAGKGISVARMVSVLGGTPVTTGFMGEGGGEFILRTLDELNIETDFVRVKGDIRTNLKVLDKHVRLTELNEPGIAVTETDELALFDKIAKRATCGTIFVLSGSICQGVDTEIYARMIRLIHQKGAWAFLDTDGEAFRAALSEKPDFIKPNRHELLEYFNVKGNLNLSELKELCQQLIHMGIPMLALSMGAEGGMFLKEDSCYYAKGLDVVCRSPVGAGDSMVAAFAYGMSMGISWEETSRLAIAASAGAVITQGTKPPAREVIEELLLEVKMQNLHG